MILQNLKMQSQEFIKQLLTEIQIPQRWEIDHICYRVATQDRYDKLKIKFAELATLLAETEVNGRLISTFHFHEPLAELEDGRIIDVLELPAPKVGCAYTEGFEHIEVVPDITLQQLQKDLHTRGVDSSLNEKDFNPELTVKTKQGAVKFHPLSLKSVVTLENNQKVWYAIEQSKVLQILKPYHPLIVGTFPLALDVPGSDVDVICSYSEQMEFIELTKKIFGGYKFHLSNVAFEIYGQPINNKHRGLEHFLIEERLLKYGGARLHSKVRELRALGYKTEPAFAQALELPGDAYEAISRIATSTAQELKALLRAARY